MRLPAVSFFCWGILTPCAASRGVRESEGRLYGRGAVDAKGPLVAFATAAAFMGRQPGWRIVVIGAVEEESASSKGARYVAGKRTPHMVVIGEPTGWQRVALGYKGRLLADVEFQRMMSHTAGPAVSAPEMAFAYWQRVLAAVGQLNTGRERAWDQVQASLRHVSSADDGLLETADMRMGFRLPPGITPDELKTLLVSVDGQGSFRFSGEEQAYRSEKNTPLVARISHCHPQPERRAGLRRQDRYERHERGWPDLALSHRRLWPRR